MAPELIPAEIIATLPISQITVTVPLVTEMAAASAGALYGAITAVEKEFDVFGAVSLAIFTGLGGGIIRDLLLQHYGIYAFQRPSLIIACIAAGLLVFYFRTAVHKMGWAMFAMDTLSLGLFAMAGADKALRAGMGFLPAVMLGTITCVGGGLIRDILVRETPQIFRYGTLYGIAGATGAAVYTALVGTFDVGKSVAALACVVVAVTLRLVSVRFDLRTTPSRDFTHHVARIPRSVIKRKPGRPL